MWFSDVCLRPVPPHRCSNMLTGRSSHDSVENFASCMTQKDGLHDLFLKFFTCYCRKWTRGINGKEEKLTYFSFLSLVPKTSTRIPTLLITQVSHASSGGSFVSNFCVCIGKKYSWWGWFPGCSFRKWLILKSMCVRHSVCLDINTLLLFIICCLCNF